MRNLGNGSDLPGCFAPLILSGCAIGLFVGGVSCAACTPSAQLHVDYATEAARCDRHEQEIIERQGTTLEEDREAMELERIRCDEARRALRGVDGGTR